MKKLLLALTASFILLAPVSAIEWGGLFDNTTTYASDSKLTQSDSLYLWSSIPLTKDGSFYIKGEGMYKFSYNSAANAISHIADLDLLKVAGTISTGKATLDISAGRFQISDLTGVIFSQNSDGVYLNYAAPKIGFSVYAGYTGLLNSNVVSILDSTGSKFTPANKVYALNANYIPVSAGISFPYLFLNQTLSAQANAFVDVSSNKYNRIYGTLSLSGPITSNLFYTLLTDIGTDLSGIMNYTKLNFNIFAGPALITVGTEYASGSHAGMKAFNGFSTYTAYSSGKGDSEMSGVIIPSVSANVPFGRTMLLVSTVKGVFTCPEATVNATGIQGDLSFIYNVLSDISLTASLSGFKGFTDTGYDKFSATLKAAISF